MDNTQLNIAYGLILAHLGQMCEDTADRMRAPASSENHMTRAQAIEHLRRLADELKDQSSLIASHCDTLPVNEAFDLYGYRMEVDLWGQGDDDEDGND